MKSGTTFEFGEVVLVPFPFTDLTQSKKRPVLVISNSYYSSGSEDVVCCAITSNIQNTNYSVLLEKKDMIRGSIPLTSRIICSKIFTLEKSLFIKKLGKVNPDITSQVKALLSKFFDGS